MKTSELNRDIKRLYKFTQNDDRKDLDKFFKYVNKEFKRLHDADNNAEYINYKSFKYMLIMNRKYNIIPFHRFYILMNEDF